jgi:hypothetical protein
MFEALLLINLASSLYMTGLVWFVQVVHYPLFDRVGEAGFTEYESLHTRLTSYVVGPPMLLETMTSLLVVLYNPVPDIAVWLWIGLSLQAVVWLSTLFLQVPCHQKLSSGFHADVHLRLVHSNWIRAVVWTLRSGLLLFLVARFLT